MFFRRVDQDQKHRDLVETMRNEPASFARSFARLKRQDQDEIRRMLVRGGASPDEIWQLNEYLN